MMKELGQNPTAQPVHHLPRSEDFLLWPPCLQSYGYRIVDRLFATRRIAAGVATPLPRGREVLDPDEVAAFMDHNNVAGLIALHQGKIVLERYGLGLGEHDRWSTMSTVKSMTAMLVGAAVQDGDIASIEDPVTRYLPQLEGSAYAQVNVRHLMTMSSGVRWSENYGDKSSDVNRYSKSLADKVPGGVLALMRQLERSEPAGTCWRYNTGDTYLLGALISATTEQSLADYMSQKIWKPAGMEADGFYTLESEGGQEIGGSRGGMVLRDFARFALFMLGRGEAGSSRVVPEQWIEAALTPAFRFPEREPSYTRSLGVVAYGYSWWLDAHGGAFALGHCGQRIYVNRAEQFALVQLAVYPEPQFAPANNPDRDLKLVEFITQLRRRLSS
jgi:CubicO group peptidase (beta-lactamase class C family)